MSPPSNIDGGPMLADAETQAVMSYVNTRGSDAEIFSAFPISWRSRRSRQMAAAVAFTRAETTVRRGHHRRRRSRPRDRVLFGGTVRRIKRGGGGAWLARRRQHGTQHDDYSFEL